MFSLGDCKGYVFRKESLYQLNIEHKPTRGDERIRIEKAGGFVQLVDFAGTREVYGFNAAVMGPLDTATGGKP